MFSIEHLTPSKERIFAGIFTLVGFVERHRAIIGIWIEPKYRGVNSHLIAKQVINYCHKTVKLENIYALTPWRHAAEHARRTGMVEVAELPNYCKFGGRVMDVTVLHSDQQLWRYQVRADLEAIGYAPETAEQLMRDYVGDEKLDLGKLMDLRAQILNKTELDNEHQQPV